MIQCAELSFILIQFLSERQGIFSAKEFYRKIMLYPLIFDGGAQARDIKVKALSPKPVRTVLVQDIRKLSFQAWLKTWAAATADALVLIRISESAGIRCSDCAVLFPGIVDSQNLG